MTGRGAIRERAESLARVAATEQLFVILTTGRTGSELLVSLLDSHPDIVCESELLASSRIWPTAFVLQRAALARRRRARAFGWKLLLNQFKHPALRLRGLGDPSTYPAQLEATGFKLIVLTRSNPVRQALSALQGAARGFHHRASERHEFAALEIDPEELLAATWILEADTRQIQAMVASTPHLALTYEHDLVDPARHLDTVARVCDYVGIDTRPVRTELVKVTPPSFREAIANFSEVAAVFERTRYWQYLEEAAES